MYNQASQKLWMLVVISVIMLLGAAIFPPISQPLEYHQFADQRSYSGIPNFLNVASNLALLLSGMAGMLFVLSPPESFTRRAFIKPSERWAYLFLFLSVAMTCFGSAYYHWMPDNDRLLWDRLPIGIGVTALLAATLSERIGLKVGLRLLPLLIMIGISSVLYWHWSEQQGAGNLNFYIVTQFYSLLLIFLLGIFFSSRYTRGADMYVVIALYGVAKVVETLDQQIYDLGQVISGHTLKHFLAALAIYWIVRMLKKRDPSS